MLADTKVARHLRKVRTIDQAGLQVVQTPLVKIGAHADHILAHNQPEHGIAQKLQLLVVRLRYPFLAGFTTVRGVRQGANQQIAVPELKPDRRLKFNGRGMYCVGQN